MGSFTEGIDTLIEQARGRWQAKVEVDQIYAHYQEVNAHFRHPRGGQAFYVRDTLYLGFWLQSRVAPGLITSRGVRLDYNMRQVADGFVQGVYLRAPMEFNVLKNSGHGSVTRDGVKVYDRPPKVRRLSEEALRRKGELRYLNHRR
jgi:hypothetical protein